MTKYISNEHQIIKNETYTGKLSAHLIHEDGKPYHTFRTSTLLIDGNDIILDNCLIENTAGKGKDVGQAIALYLDGDDIVVKNCKIIGHQDTLFLAPLPEKEREVDGFLGPKQFTPRTKRTFKFENCYIEGGVDFVFGGATAYFDNCEFCSNEKGYVFAPNTPKDVEVGFVCNNCKFTCKDEVEDESCYIARPWRDYAKVTINNCYLDRHINKKGWIGWRQDEPLETTKFKEVNSYGPGSDDNSRPSWVEVVRDI